MPPHFGNVVLSGCLSVDTAITHHINPQGMVRDLRGNIDRARHSVERIHKLREALPIPAQPLVQCGTRNILNRLHEVDKAGAMFFPHWRKSYTAISEQDCRYAVPRR